MIIGLIVLCVILLIVGFVIEEINYDGVGLTVAMISFFVGVAIFIFACFHGFINYPKTEGSHQGTLTAVDQEGVIFQRYKVYLKSSGFTTQGDETVYCLYLDETELANELKNNIGKVVTLHYGHDGGYIGYKSCGTYHIKDVEVVSEEEK